MKKTIVVAEVSTSIFWCDQTLEPERVYGHFLSMIPIGGFALVPNLAKMVSVPICILIFLFLHCTAQILIYWAWVTCDQKMKVYSSWKVSNWLLMQDSNSCYCSKLLREDLYFSLFCCNYVNCQLVFTILWDWSREESNREILYALALFFLPNSPM